MIKTSLGIRLRLTRRSYLKQPCSLIVAMLIGDHTLVDARIGDTRRGDGQSVITDADSTLGLDRLAVVEPADLWHRIAYEFTHVHLVILTLNYLSLIRGTVSDAG